MMRRFKVAAMGGTFDIIHKGHLALLNKAFETSEFVIIGVTSDEFVARKGKNILHNYEERVKALRDLLDERFKGRYTISRLEEDFGPTIFTKEVEALIVSKETEAKGITLNNLRRERNLPSVEIIVTDLVLAKDGKRISSTRIRNGEIDREGNIIRS